MSHNPFNVPLSIEIRPTFQKTLLVLIPHLLICVLVVSFGVFGLIIKLTLVVILIISTAYYYRLHLGQNLKKSITSIQQDSSKNWFITTYNTGDEATLKVVILLASSFISKYLIVLNYREENGSQYSIIITKDSVSTNDFRYLRVRLKLTNVEKS